MERVADYIIKKIHAEGIDHIFLVNGRGVLFLTDAVAREKDFNFTSTYHEQGASFAAMAYSSLNSKGGACLVSTGCAATNAITAALCAYQDNLPMIFISGQHMLNETTRFTGLPIRTYGSQETDIINIVQSITKYAIMLTDPKQIAIEIEKAFYIMREGRQGPVWIDIPLNIQNARINPDELEHFKILNELKTTNLQISEITNEISKAKRPLLLLGGGVRSANAISEIIELVEKTNLPVVFTPSAVDVYGLSYKLSIGAIGSIGGSRAGNFALQNADFILAVGTRLCSQITGSDFEHFTNSAKIFIVDIDSIEHKKIGVKFDKLFIVDAKFLFEQMLKESISKTSEEWINKCCHWKKSFSISNEEFIIQQKNENIIDLYQFADSLSNFLPEKVTIITDAGFESLIIPATIRFRKGQRCLFPKAQGAMGYAVSAILGSYFAGSSNIIAIIGDGSIMMNVQELQIIKSNNIPVKIFVINNNMYAVIRKRQKDLFRKRTIGNDPSDGLAAPDFRKVAECFGFIYEKIQNYTELENKIKDVMEINEPILCEVICTPEQKYLHKSYARNEEGHFVNRPLEDLSPFIDRDKFIKEMLVE